MTLVRFEGERSRKVLLRRRQTPFKDAISCAIQDYFLDEQTRRLSEYGIFLACYIFKYIHLFSTFIHIGQFVVFIIQFWRLFMNFHAVPLFIQLQFLYSFIQKSKLAQMYECLIILQNCINVTFTGNIFITKKYKPTTKLVHRCQEISIFQVKHYFIYFQTVLSLAQMLLKKKKKKFCFHSNVPKYMDISIRLAWSHFDN